VAWQVLVGTRQHCGCDDHEVFERKMFDERDWAAPAFWFLFVVALPLQAATTNQIAISYNADFISVTSPKQSDSFTGRFLREVTEDDSMVFDRFTGPSSRLVWERRQNMLRYGNIERFNSAGAGMFAAMAMDSLRIAAMDALPFELWQDYWQGRLAAFLAGSIGNPQEEHIDVTSISYSAVRSTWERENEKAGIQWGYRPWRTSPYVYFLAHAGHLDGRSLITLEGRAGYTLLGSAQLAGRLTFQLPASFRLAAAGEVDPARAGSRDPSARHLAVNLEWAFPSHSAGSEGACYVGFRSGVNNGFVNLRQENLLVAGLSKRW
jgi:hypothetical protein